MAYADRKSLIRTGNRKGYLQFQIIRGDISSSSEGFGYARLRENDLCLKEGTGRSRYGWEALASSKLLPAAGL